MRRTRVYVQADLPKFVQVQILARIDLPSSVLVCVILVLAAKKVLDCGCCRCVLLRLWAACRALAHQISVFEKRVHCSDSVILKEIDLHFIVLRFGQLLDVCEKFIQLGQLQELDELLDYCVGRSNHIFVLLSSTAPNCTYDVILDWILFVNCPQVCQLN